MPAITPVVLAGLTPVSVTFTPMRRNTDETVMADRRRLLPVLYGSLKKTVKQLRNQDRSLNGNYRVNVKIDDPIVRSVDGSDTTVEDIIIDINVRVPGIATLAEKQHAVKLAVSALQHAYVTSSIETGEADYA